MYNELDSIYESLYEYYINDYIIFEGVLRRDYMECIGILNEDGNKNFLQKMWEQIKKAFIKLRDKIKELFTKIKDKMLYNDKRVKKIYYTYKEYYDKENGKLNEFTMKNFKPFNMSVYTPDSKCQTIIHDMFKSITGGSFDAMLTYNTEDKYNSLKSKMDNIDGIKKEIHDKLWLDKKVEYPFKENKMKENMKENVQNSLSNIYKVCKDLEKRFLQNIESVSKDTEKEIDNYLKINDDKSFDDAIKKLQTRLKIVQISEKMVIIITNTCIDEFMNIFRESLRLYVAGGKYLKKTIKIVGNAEENDKNEKESSKKSGNNNDEFKDVRNKYSAVEKGIKENDIDALREAIGTLPYRRSFDTGEFYQLVKYVESRGIKLKDKELKGKLISDGKDTFTEDDFAKAIFELKRNFCDERIKDVKKIREILRDKKKDKSTNESYISDEYENILSEMIYELN